MLRTLGPLLIALTLSLPAHALELTQRQIPVSGSLNVAGAAKIADKILDLESAGTAPIYLIITATEGTAQGVLLVADTIQSVQSPVVAVVVTQVHGAGSAVAPFADRVVIYPSAGMVFTEVPYEGVKKPEPPKPVADGAEAPKEVPKVEPGEVLLQKARTSFLDRFWERVAHRIHWKSQTLHARIEEGGFILTPEEALEQKIVDGVVDRITLLRLPEVKRELKTVVTEKKERTVAPKPE
ncbi:MAG: ATP-dependent Clp protease proteolytic subunit [Deltaproteobacteria bacterium]|nr:ATP-dependent Clp protease proteolytic subunit [Deltaproteobacteria bacterium]MCB9788126.1 ATP-dependent Clp protease proteolytic subunit [Deltaproteobacteria bacterium]